MNRFKFLVSAALLSALCLSLPACDDDDELIEPEKKTVQVIADDEPEPVNPADGFWVVNEDWFGHDNGTVNYFKRVDATTYEPSYRVYRAANNDEQLGVTSQFGAVWGGNLYLMSKQGNRLVVADAGTIKQKAVLDEIGGDGRGFVGIDDTKAYVSHSNGIAVFDIPSLSITKQLEGVEGQTGMMCLAENRVFAVSQDHGLYIINTGTDEVEKTIEGSYGTLTRSKDGQVWVAGSESFLCLNPSTLESEEVAYPENGEIYDSWGAWNAGSLCASTQKNVLYWGAGGSRWGGANKVLKYDIDSKAFSTIYTLGLSDEGTQMELYGAGMRVDPLTDELILTAIHSGWGSGYAYNWIYKLDNAGNEITHFAVKGDNGAGASWAGNAADWDGKYFWFPAVPVFQDANEPQILLNQIILIAGESMEIDLDEKIIDYDNTLASMQLGVTPDEKNLVDLSLAGHVLKVEANEETGSSTCTLIVISNGVRVEKEIQIEVIDQDTERV